MVKFWFEISIVVDTSSYDLGGDADTIGAVCGQIAGAYYGYSAIPERWLTAVKDRQNLDKLIDDFISVCQTQSENF